MRTPEGTMSSFINYYLGIDVHKRQAQIAVPDDEGTDFKETAENHGGTHAAIEAGSNYFIGKGERTFPII